MWSSVCLSLLAVASVLSGCSARSDGSAATFVTTIHPLEAILTELVGTRATVSALVPPGASPHTYEIRPSDALASETAKALFFVSPHLDGWASRLPARTRIAVFDLVPEALKRKWAVDPGGDDHDHGSDDLDPHFWSDPLTVKALLPALVEQLVKADPEGEAMYRANAGRFAADLDAFDAELQQTMAPVKGRAVALFHPSWDYFLTRYGIVDAGVVELSPGKEPTAQYLAALSRTLKEREVRAVLTEPQLPPGPARAVAEAAGIRTATIDPNGGVPGRMTYRELIGFNASSLVEALQ